MVKPLNIQRFNADLLIRLDDGTRWRAIESVGDIWVVSAIEEPPVPPPPPTGDRFIFPASLSLVTSEYGQRSGRLHAGMDFSSGSGGGAGGGDPMIASSAGKVQISSPSHGGYGETVVLDHGNGLATLYAHMQTGSRTVGVGAIVTQGQKLGNVGKTGQSFGNHIHFETHEGGYRWNASSRNPREFIPKWNAL